MTRNTRRASRGVFGSSVHGAISARAGFAISRSRMNDAPPRPAWIPPTEPRRRSVSAATSTRAVVALGFAGDFILVSVSGHFFSQTRDLLGGPQHDEDGAGRELLVGARVV